MRAVGGKLEEVLAVLSIAARLVAGGEVCDERFIEAEDVVVLLDEGVDCYRIGVVEGSNARIVYESACELGSTIAPKSGEILDLPERLKCVVSFWFSIAFATYGTYLPA